jgi:hypothetical protein
MAESPNPPELVEAYRLIKAGQRQDAAQILRDYLGKNSRDAKAWWLMAHAADKPDTVRRCLETVLKLEPDNAKAREKLDKLIASAPPAASSSPIQPPPPPIPARRPSAQPPVSPPAPADDEPDDSFFTVPASAEPPTGRRSSQPVKRGSSGPVQRASSRPITATQELGTPPVIPTPAGPPPAPSVAPTFEEFSAQQDPFATPAVHDPFDDIPARPFNPFDKAQAFDPAAHAKLGSAPPSTAQAAGTGNQPEWGPGLAFVKDAFAPTPGAEAAPAPLPHPTGKPADVPFEDFTATTTKPGIERVIGMFVLAIAVVVGFGIILYAADSAGLLSLRGDGVPEMMTLEGGSFAIRFPENWDRRCLDEASGYPVCGIANHRFYNEVEFFAGQDVNIGAMISDSFDMAFSGQDLPDQRTSIIVMDVPRTSPSYDDGSWAKTSYEYWQQGWSFDRDAKVKYDRKDVTIDGFPAYYYKFTSEGSWKEAAWDVYIPHDGIILWLRVDYFGPRGDDIPAAMVEAMIESIDIKPVEEWQ